MDQTIFNVLKLVEQGEAKAFQSGVTINNDQVVVLVFVNKILDPDLDSIESPVLLPELELADLRNSGLSDRGVVKLLQYAPKVDDLTLSKLRITGACLEQLEFPHLKTLHLQASRHLNRDAFRSLLRFPTLETLWLSDTPLRDEDMEIVGQLTNLEKLFLCNTGITDRSLEYLTSLQQLRYALVDDTKVTNEGFNKLASVLPNWRPQARL